MVPKRFHNDGTKKIHNDGTKIKRFLNDGTKTVRKPLHTYKSFLAWQKLIFECIIIIKLHVFY